jgi:serine/threonine protein kinase
MQSFFASEFEVLRRISQPTTLSPLRYVHRREESPTSNFCIPSKRVQKLSEFISPTSPLTQTQKIVVALSLLAGLQYLHSEHCIHGSLNLENILIDKDFFPIIISDGLEGIAKAVKSPIQRSSFEFTAQRSFLARRKMNCLMFLVME